MPEPTFPDDSATGVNTRAFSAIVQDRGEARRSHLLTLQHYVNRCFGLRFDTTYLTAGCVVKRYADRSSIVPTTGLLPSVG